LIYTYTTKDDLELECHYELELPEPATYENGVQTEPATLMAVNVYMVCLHGSEIYDILSSYLIQNIEEEILRDLNK